MSVTSGFYNSSNGDRKYNAEQMSAIFDGIINDGVLSNVGTAFAVTAGSGNSINVGVGRAWFNSTWLYNDSVLSLTLDDAEVVLNRIDAVVIEIDRSDSVRAGSIKIVKGTPASSPQNPTLTNTEYVHQYPLAYIRLDADSSSVSQANITNKIGTSDCPYVTGILQVQNIDNIVAQWGAQWIVWYTSTTNSGEAAKEEMVSEWNQWFSDETSDCEAEIASWTTQMKSDFQAWFNELQVILDDDTAAELGNRVVLLQNRFETLAKEWAVYSDLNDSTGDTIEDQNGNVIQGRTIFSLNGTVEDSSIGDMPSGSIENESFEFEIGDILTTTRTDLNEKWFLCNGAWIESSRYPELSRLLETDMWAPLALPTDGINKIRYINGLFVAVRGGTIAWTEDPVNSTWESTHFDASDIASNAGGGISIRDISYADGKWVMVGMVDIGVSTNEGVFISWATELDGEWHHYMRSGVVYSENYIYDVVGLAYGNGYWCVIVDYTDDRTGEHTRYIQCYCSNNIENDSWTVVNIDSASTSGYDLVPIGVVFNGEQFIVGADYRETLVDENASAIYLYSATTPTGASNPWSKTTLESEDSSRTGYWLDEVLFTGNETLFVGRMKDTYSDLYTSVWSIPNSLTGITQHDYEFDSTDNTEEGNNVVTVTFNDEYLFCVRRCQNLSDSDEHKYTILSISRENLNDFSEVTICDYTTVADSYRGYSAFGNGLFVFGIGEENLVSYQLGFTKLPFDYEVAAHLPTISPDSSYAYIKALGGI